MPRDQRDISVTFDKLKREVAAILHQRDELLKACKTARYCISTGHQGETDSIALAALNQVIKMVEGENDSRS